MDIEIYLLMTICVSLIVMIGLSAYSIFRDTTKIQNNFNMQIAAATANKKPDIHKLPYTDLMKIVNNTIDYYTSQNMEVLTLSNKTSDEISLSINDLTVDISAKVVMSISPMVHSTILEYVTEEFFSRYVFNSVQALVVLNIEKQRKTLDSQQRKNQKTVEPKEK